ncbi:thioredoxin family protein [bacterium]|nr:thioredoxin family protein [bacterium]
MIRKSFILFTVLLFAAGAYAQNGAWTDDFNAAKAGAKSSGKYIFLNFSGSDWCKWCIKLSDEVLSKKAFLDYAEDNLVLVIADFPRSKKQSDALKSQNESLLKKYKVRGFPTVVILDPQGNMVVQTGYREGGPEAYVSHVKEVIKMYESKG